jgi:hypothetical protein
LPPPALSEWAEVVFMGRVVGMVGEERLHLWPIFTNKPSVARILSALTIIFSL